jgi:hypothetical protein
MKLSIKAGSTSQSLNIFIQDSTSTTGAGLTGLTNATAGLTAYYALPKAAPVAITLAALAAITTAYASGGFVAVDGTNMPGWYRLDLPDASFVTGLGRFVSLHIKGATNMAPLPIEIELTSWDNQDGMRGGMTALPNAIAASFGGLPTVDANNSVKIQTVTKRNQALAGFAFLMTDSTTHNPVTGKVVTVTRNIDAGTFLAGTLSAVTEISNGLYRVDFAAADLNGTVVTLRSTAAGCDDLFVTLLTEP